MGVSRRGNRHAPNGRAKIFRWLFISLAIATPFSARAQGVLHAPEPLSVEYGFLSNSDMDRAGTFSIEKDTVGSFGRRGRYFLSVDTQFNFAYALTDHLQLTIGPQMTYASVHTVNGMVDTRQLLLGGLGGDVRIRLLDRQAAPFGLTLQFSPQVRFANEGASRGRGTGVATTISLDRELVRDWLYGTVNLSHEITRQRFADVGKVEDTMRLGIGAGLATPVTRSLHVGAEVRYFRRFDGFGFGRLEGEAIYAGPTVYMELSRSSWFSLSWQAQIAGREFVKRLPLDLAGFERHQVRLRVGYDF